MQTRQVGLFPCTQDAGEQPGPGQYDIPEHHGSGVHMFGRPEHKGTRWCPATKPVVSDFVPPFWRVRCLRWGGVSFAVNITPGPGEYELPAEERHFAFDPYLPKTDLPINPSTSALFGGQSTDAIYYNDGAEKLEAQRGTGSGGFLSNQPRLAAAKQAGPDYELPEQQPGGVYIEPNLPRLTPLKGNTPGPGERGYCRTL